MFITARVVQYDVGIHDIVFMNVHICISVDAALEDILCI